MDLSNYRSLRACSMNEVLEQLRQAKSKLELYVSEINPDLFVSLQLPTSFKANIVTSREVLELEDDELYRIYITDEEEKVLGALNPGDLILNKQEVKVKDIMDENINIIRHDVDIKEAIEVIAKYDLLSVPVIDENNKLVGVVHSHDLIDEVLYPMWKKKFR